MYPIRQSTAVTIPVFAHDINGDAVTGKVTGDWTKRISKNGGAFAAMTVTITEMENGWYSVPLDTGHTNTEGILTVTLTATGVKQVNLQWRVSVAGAGANLTHIDGIANSAATLNLTQLNIVNAAGDAIVASSTGSNGRGINASGNGTSAGIRSVGGATGHGIAAVGGATSGDGIRATVTSGKALGDAAVDSILDRAIAEPSSIFSWASANLRTIVQLVGAMTRNKQTQTATTFALRNAADDANIGTAPVSDDLTTTTKGALS